jgi:YD repeat-containing protein
MSHYDAAGNLAAITDPQNRVTVFDYDAMGRMTDMDNVQYFSHIFRGDVALNLVWFGSPKLKL